MSNNCGDQFDPDQAAAPGRRSAADGLRRVLFVAVSAAALLLSAGNFAEAATFSPMVESDILACS